MLAELDADLQLPGSELVRGAGGIAEGLPEKFADATLPKFRPGGILLACAGGGAGLFSAMIGGWANGAIGSQPVTREVRMTATRYVLDPTGRAVGRRTPAARPAGVDRRAARRAARHLQAARRRVPRPPASERLADDGATVQRYKKPTFTKPAPVDLRHEIATQCDLVIEALAD